MMDKKCLACDEFRDNCIGSTAACGKFKPIDFDREAPGFACGFALEEVPNEQPAATESRRDKFRRIGDKRKKQVLESIRKLKHLTSSYYRQRAGVTAYTYEWTIEDAQGLIHPIEAALAELKAELIASDMPREHGLIEESK